MKAITLILLLALTAFGLPGFAVPANPRTIAGIDGVGPKQISESLTIFCRKNGCRYVYNDQFGPAWNIFAGKYLIAQMGDGCAAISHRYCFQLSVGDTRADRFFNSRRGDELKADFLRYGARVTLMDCSVEPTGHGFGYVCTNGKPPP